MKCLNSKSRVVMENFLFDLSKGTDDIKEVSIKVVVAGCDICDVEKQLHIYELTHGEPMEFFPHEQTYRYMVTSRDTVAKLRALVEKDYSEKYEYQVRKGLL